MSRIEKYRLWLNTARHVGGEAEQSQGSVNAEPPVVGLLACLAARRPLDQSIILSIYTGHDAAITLLSSGKVLLNLELERFSRIKHDYGFREGFLEKCLSSADIGLDDIDLVCLNNAIPGPTLGRPGTITNPCPVPSTVKRVYIPFLASVMGRDIPAVAVGHHVAHAASAYYTSPYER